MKIKPRLIVPLLAVFLATVLLSSLAMPQKVSAAVKTGAALDAQAYKQCFDGLGGEGGLGMSLEEFIKSDFGPACKVPYIDVYNDPSPKNYDKWNGRYVDSKFIPGSSKCANDYSEIIRSTCSKAIEVAKYAKEADLKSGGGSSGTEKESGKKTDDEIRKLGEGDADCEGMTGDLLKVCTNAFLAGYRGSKSKDEACKAFENETQKLNKCRQGYDAGKRANPNSTNEQTKEVVDGKKTDEAAVKDEVDCDATPGVPLSWIICPVIDSGAKLTDFVFKDVVQPMMENVPVSTNKDGGAYKSWSQFRVIANILLVGSLLVIVYSQAKGGR